jgi:hypothetical protein
LVRCVRLCLPSPELKRCVVLHEGESLVRSPQLVCLPVRRLPLAVCLPVAVYAGSMAAVSHTAVRLLYGCLGTRSPVLVHTHNQLPSQTAPISKTPHLRARTMCCAWAAIHASDTTALATQRRRRGTRHNLGPILEQQLQRLLPPDAHERAVAGNVHVAVTRLALPLRPEAGERAAQPRLISRRAHERPLGAMVA